jgi:haloacetate dehalogenase
MTDLFPGFDDQFVEDNGVSIRIRCGGNGPPLLLLHGHPQTHLMWHRIVPRLSGSFRVVLADLPGYGDSSRPESNERHEPYSKRSMSNILVGVMEQLGYTRFTVVGHDRGGRVGYRMAIDHPKRVERLAVLDIIPTGEAYRRTDRRFAFGYFHWFFLSQPEPFPEQMINSNPDAFYFRGDRSIHEPAALAEYLRCVHDPATVHAMCEDYRAGISIDRELDEQDMDAGRKIGCPTLVLWAGHGELGNWYDVAAVWRAWADDLTVQAVDAGHYMAEQAPSETLAALEPFLVRKR